MANVICRRLYDTDKCFDCFVYERISWSYGIFNNTCTTKQILLRGITNNETVIVILYPVNLYIQTNC